MKTPFFSALTIGTVGLGSKAFLKFLSADVKVVGMRRLLDTLGEVERGERRGKGVVTGVFNISFFFRPEQFIIFIYSVSNHISVYASPSLNLCCAAE